MYLSDTVNACIAKLKSRSPLRNNYIIAAFPFSYSPTVPDKPIITVSPAGMNAKKSAIGQSRLCGSFSIRFDVFVPYSAESPCTSDIIEQIIIATADFYPDEIEVSEIVPKDSVGCYTASIIIKYNAMVYYGGNE